MKGLTVSTLVIVLIALAVIVGIYFVINFMVSGTQEQLLYIKDYLRVFG